MPPSAGLPAVADRHLFFAFTDVPDRAALSAWYDGVHLPRVVDLPGVFGAQRFEVGDTKPLKGTQPIDFGHGAAYEISGSAVDFRNDLERILTESGDAPAPTTGLFVRPVSEPQTSSAADRLTDLAERYLWLVFSRRPADADGAEFDRWYDEEHIPDFLAAPGVVRAQRFMPDDVPALPGVATPDLGHLALYEIDGDPAAARNYVKEQLMSGAMILPDYMHQSFPAMFLRPVSRYFARS